MAEMLLQSHTKYIDLLPALPQDLPEGNIRGIKARGGFELDFSWKEGKLKTLKVISTAGNPLVLRYENQTISIPTKKGEVYQFDEDLKQK